MMNTGALEYWITRFRGVMTAVLVRATSVCIAPRFPPSKAVNSRKNP